MIPDINRGLPHACIPTHVSAHLQKHTYTTHIDEKWKKETNSFQLLLMLPVSEGLYYSGLGYNVKHCLFSYCISWETLFPRLSVTVLVSFNCQLHTA